MADTQVTFADLGLSDEVVSAVVTSGYTKPTPIQEKAIPYVLMGRDVLGCAQTGTGKTASFTLPMIDILSAGRAKARMPRSLIIAPTRELAAQVSENFVKYGQNTRLSMALLIGGVSMGDQEAKLDRGVDVLIATPGRLLDHFERGRILLTDVKILVIDEADRMLDMGFIPDVERIVSLLPTIRQTLFFSATMAPEIKRLADKFLMNPKEVSVDAPASAAENVAQHLIRCSVKDKRDALRSLLKSETVDSALIFCNRKRDIGVLHRSLQRYGIDAVQLHGDMSQPARTETLAKFKAGEVRLVICSDVAARGIDIKGLSHVFNFDVPSHAEDYVHRIGRTGRAGMSGRAFTLATPEDSKLLSAVERLIGKKIPVMQLDGAEPAGAESGPDKAVEMAPETAQPRKSGRGRGARSNDNAVSADEQPASSGKSSRRSSRKRGERSESPAIAVEPTVVADVQEAKPRETSLTGGGVVEAFPTQRTGSGNGRGRGGRDREDNARSVTGFGDEVPAFLLKAVPKKATG
ncbi:DEAD/DEAH box helicase [Thalassobaculum sp.]|uniref:DEAD/DEAH box helicase n=1 Tax=Thalassobaculum sp. TaxID=2022740 RepID=UPI0032EB3319